MQGSKTRAPIQGKLFILIGDDIKSAQLNDLTGMLQPTQTIEIKEVDQNYELIAPLALRISEGELPPADDVVTATIKARLDVYGDGEIANDAKNASLIVPTMKSGEKWVRGEVVEKGIIRSKPEQRAISLKNRHVA